jgi:outer membrane protein assembly factor BamB
MQPLNLRGQSVGAAETASGVAMIRWQPLPLINRYRLQIASDQGFDDIVFDRAVTGTEFKLNGLPRRHYFWRIAPAVSETGRFVQFGQVAWSDETQNLVKSSKRPSLSIVTSGWKVVAQNSLNPFAIVAVKDEQRLLLASDLRGRIFAFDAETGEGKWSVSFNPSKSVKVAKPDITNRPVAGAVASVGSLTVLLVPSAEGAKAFDTATGRMLWSLPLEHGFILDATVFDLNGRGADDFIITTNEPSVKVVEANSGAVVSDIKLAARPFAPPVAYRRGPNGEFALALAGGEVQVYNRQGALVRSADFGPGMDRRPFTIALAPDPMLLIGERGRLAALDVATLKQVWTVEIAGGQPAGGLAQVASISDSGGMIIVSATDGRIAKLDVKTGKSLWETSISPGAEVAIVSDVDHDNQIDVITVSAAQCLTVISGQDGAEFTFGAAQGQPSGPRSEQLTDGIIFGTINDRSWIYFSDETGPGLQGLNVISPSPNNTRIGNSARQIR